MKFQDRTEAGEKLAKKLARYGGKKNTMILVMSPQALKLGKIVAEKLTLPLDLFITKKIPHPVNDNFAMGVIGPEGYFFLNPDSSTGVSPSFIGKHRKKLEKQIQLEYKKYKRKAPEIKGKTVLLVDDGIKGSAMIVPTIHILAGIGARIIIVGTPVADKKSIEIIKKQADAVIAVVIAGGIDNISDFYKKFPTLVGQEIAAILKSINRKLIN
jgi:predicted phosphoribosyltransferase